MNLLRLLLISMISVFLIGIAGCSSELEIKQQNEVIISFNNESRVYFTKIGKEVEISAQVESKLPYTIAWIEQSDILATTDRFTYIPQKEGEYFITCQVTDEQGEITEEEIRVDVTKLAPPVITLTIPEEGVTIFTDTELSLAPYIQNYEACTYEWTNEDEVVGKDSVYTFSSKIEGDFIIKLAVTNSDGKDEITVPISVSNEKRSIVKFIKESNSISDQVRYLVPGRRVFLQVSTTPFYDNLTYKWFIDQREIEQHNQDHLFISEQDISSTSIVRIEIHQEKNQMIQMNRYIKSSSKIIGFNEISIEKVATEGTYRRQSTTSHNTHVTAVYEYLPAPGQFINKDYSFTTMPQANEYALQQLQNNSFISLGGFGGYVVLGFDHSIPNNADYDFALQGNSFDGSSEPGIVYVMQDENGDGQPNDTWYQLKGSEYNKGTHRANYEVTYYRPNAPQMPVIWIDSDGTKGQVDYMGSFHTQDYYYPLWMEADSYTLRGVCLTHRTTQDPSTGFWSNGSFDWGYADNFGSDRLSQEDNHNASQNRNHFKIEHAVDVEGNETSLQYIDFIMVQNAINMKAGWLGEVSTELFGATDLHQEKK